MQRIVPLRNSVSTARGRHIGSGAITKGALPRGNPDEPHCSIAPHNGYTVGKYVSIEVAIERTKKTYYEALAASSVGWNEGENDYTPFVTYMLGVIGACYATLDERFSLLSSGGSNEGMLRRCFDSLVASASKREIMDANPAMSQRTVERILQKLQAEGYIEKVGAARATRYRKSR